MLTYISKVRLSQTGQIWDFESIGDLLHRQVSYFTKCLIEKYRSSRTAFLIKKVVKLISGYPPSGQSEEIK